MDDCFNECKLKWSHAKAVPTLLDYGARACRLCWHNFKNNRCARKLENIPGIMGNFLENKE